jgi:hypothetical protein
MAEEFKDEDSSMQQCKSCGRSFNYEPYTRHIKICKRVFVNKRKEFDSMKDR